MTAVLLRGVPHDGYHRDVIGGVSHPPRLSRSIACKLLECPLKAWAAHPRLGGGVDDSSKASTGGSLLHQLLLGDGPEVEIVRIHTNKAKIGPTVPAENFLTREAQEIRDAALAAGRIPVLERFYQSCLDIRDRLVAQLDLETEGAWSEAESEVTALWEEEGVLAKARMDKLHLGRGLILDPKFVYSAHPSTFGRGMVRSGYDIQHHVYRRAVELAHPELAGRTELQYLPIEVDKAGVPVQVGGRFIISKPRIGGSMASLGGDRWRRAFRLWQSCLASGHWPAYDEYEPIEAKPWDLTGELLEQVSSTGDPEWL